jgi:phosphatidylglycerophosphatase C
VTPVLTVDQLLGLLQAATKRLGPAGGGLAFDGDGTLWAGDVGDDVFFHALDQELLGDVARPQLQRLAKQHGLDPSGSASELARRIYDAHLRGLVSQPVTYAMMAWCFAGHSVERLKAISREALAKAGLAGRLHRELAPIIGWARSAGLKTVVVSASPHPVVEVAAEAWGLAPNEIAAVRPATSRNGQIEPRVAGDVPYGEKKTHRGRALLRGARWIAAFGDNHFDAAMLTAADLGVAVRPKPALRELLSKLDGVVELAPG